MRETLASVIGLAVFLFLAYQAGKLVNTFRHRRFTRAWRPLMRIVNGRVEEDPLGGGASSWLVGEWKGLPIHARMAPDIRSTGSSTQENRFSIGVAQLEGRTNWHLGDRGFPPEPDIITDDKALEDRLRAAGVIDLARQAQCWNVRFDRSSRYLFVKEDVSPMWTPPPERFTVLLDFAVSLARIQSNVNAA